MERPRANHDNGNDLSVLRSKRELSLIPHWKQKRLVELCHQLATVSYEWIDVMVPVNLVFSLAWLLRLLPLLLHDGPRQQIRVV